ncbi:GGDEF domain-containing protein [Thermovibrio sp.]
MTSLRSYIIKRAVVIGVLLLASTFLFNYFSTKEVRDIYHRNLLYLSVLLEKNFQFFLELYGNRELINYQLSEAVSKIPEIEAIYISYGGREFVFPEKFLRVAKSLCRDADENKVFTYGDFVVVCLPVKEEYASVFLESKRKGTFIVLFNRSQEDRFVAGWLAGVLVLTFLVASLGFLVISSIWSEIGENFTRLEKLITLVEKNISGEATEQEKSKIKELTRNLSINEFKEVGSLIYFLMERVKALNEEVERLAITDPLTSLYNRNYMKIFVEGKLLPIWRRKKFPLSVALLDLDNFKQINDTFGHQKGDEVLRKWAQIVKEELRGGDVPIRFGGEEFLIIFPYTTKKNALNAVERIRKRFIEVDFGIGRRVSFSGGVAGYPDDVDDLTFLDDLIKIADERLYKAKRQGKNRVIAD